ncbi:Ig-like domain-containing domain [Treponema sp. R6D11]
MLRLLISIPLVLLGAYLLSCGFADLRPIGITIEPGISDSLLAEAYSPVILTFSAQMEKNEAEGILQVSSDSGVVNGDRFWKDNSLYFVPVAGWTAGVRYTLTLSGTINSVDGREMRLERFVSFYAINKNNRPFLEWYSPSCGESTGTVGVCFEFHFSRPMDRLSVESALSLNGITAKTFEWSDNDKILNVIPESKLSAFTLYKWNLQDSAKSTDGVPLAKTYSSYFTTDIDILLPHVENVYPVINTDGQWFPTGANIETGLMLGQGIAISFNKPMGENVLRSLRFEPSLTGRVDSLSEKSIVYIFTKDPEPEKTYTLIVSGDTQDVSGLKLGEDYKVIFTPDILFLNILSFSAADVPLVIDKNLSDLILSVPVEPATNEMFLSIRFSLPFKNEEKQNIALKISLNAFFPKTISPTALKKANWVGGDILQMWWEGLTAGYEEPHFYKLTIPGGKGGITMTDGTYMKEDFIVYLETEK